jgi:hypothetical protein
MRTLPFYWDRQSRVNPAYLRAIREYNPISEPNLLTVSRATEAAGQHG